MYQEHIMDHYKHPRNAGNLIEPTIEFSDINPMCGDTVHITLAHDKNGKIIAARHTTQGCAISQAGASMLFEQLEGKTLKQALDIPKERILEEFGTELTVSRVKCALLALSALKKGIVRADELTEKQTHAQHN